MRKTKEQLNLFNLIKDHFFINPNPPKEELSTYLGDIQAHLSALIGNMLEWYMIGSNYTPLEKALEGQLDKLKETTIDIAKSHLNNVQREGENSPFVVAHWDLNKIKLPFAQSKFKSLIEALPIIDTDTGGAIRFNHHFIGELHPQGNIIALAASIAAAFLNENAVVPKVSPSLTTWEKEVVRWIWHMLDNQQPGECGCTPDTGSKTTNKCHFRLDGRSGRIVAGGTIANLTALFIAREKLHKWCADKGIRFSDIKPVVLYSGHSHYSIKKAARIVGFNYEKEPALSDIVPIHGQNYWFLTADDVLRAIKVEESRGRNVVMVSALAGATDTGFVDDLDGIAEVISEYNHNRNGTSPPIYYHVDAAMGGPFRLLSSLTWEIQQRDLSLGGPRKTKQPKKKSGKASLFDGIQRADAITIDGHKYFYCNYPCGGIFVRPSEEEFNLLFEDAGYLHRSGESEVSEPEELRRLYRNLGLKKSPLRDFDSEWRDRRGLRTLEGSRGIIGITQLYFTLKVFGPEGIKALLQHTVEMTKKLRNLIKATKVDRGLPALELITNGPLNQTLFRVVTDWDNRTNPQQIDLDNDINFLIPHYANWTQTKRLQKALSINRRKQKRNELTKADKLIESILEGRYTIPFYVGTDAPLDHLPEDQHGRAELMDTFLDYVWRINGEAEKGRCPSRHKLNIQNWLNTKDKYNNAKKKRTLQALKAIITHPYTDEDVLRKFVNTIREGAKVIQELLTASS